MSNRYEAGSFKSKVDMFFSISVRGSSIKQELTAGLTIFLAMVYSVIVVPSMLSSVGFPKGPVFIATCLVAGLGSLLMGFLANLPLAVGCAISLTAFTAFSLVSGQNIPIPVVLGAVFVTGVLLVVMSITGLRAWFLRHLPTCIAHGTGIGIGLFLLFIGANSVGLIIRNSGSGLPIAFGKFNSLPVFLTLLGLAAMVGLEKRKVPGGILMVIIVLSLLGLSFDTNMQHISDAAFGMPTLTGADGETFIMSLDIFGALQLAILPSILALFMSAAFDITGVVGAVVGQANLLQKDVQAINSSRAAAVASFSSIFASILGSSPAVVYLESSAGVAVGGLFLSMIFLAPLSFLVPSYATAPALMYVGLLMLSNILHLDFNDFVGAMAGLVCAVFIVFSCNIVTGIMLGLCTFVVGRIVSGDFLKLSIGTVLIATVLATFYAGGWAI